VRRGLRKADTPRGELGVPRRGVQTRGGAASGVWGVTRPPTLRIIRTERQVVSAELSSRHRRESEPEQDC
jgi:hypothetical protein